MTVAEHSEDNPYIGPSPFERGNPKFFGRDREIRELVSLVVAHRVVVLHAASGAGKTSLLNAGLVPVLEQEEAFEVLPVARLRPVDLALGSDDRNVYTSGVISNWIRERDDDATLALAASVADALATWEHVVDDDGFPSPRVVIFDQFEELFSLFPDRWADREAFLVQVADALERDPMLRVVFALREDYLAQLVAHAALLPGGMRTRLRIERLGPAAAEAAISRPLEATPRPFGPGVAAKLASDLRAIRVHGAGGQVEVVGQFVEPVHLQVACRSLWAELPADVEVITEEHLRAFGNVDEVLLGFYEEAVRYASSVAGTNEWRLRESLQAAFLTAGDTRGTAYRGTSSTAGISNPAIDALENRHLLRAEWRAGARWYELTHDRLIEPIRASNADFAARAAHRRNRRVLVGSAMVGVLGCISLVMALARDEPTPPKCPTCHARFQSVRLATNVALREFLERQGAPTAGLTDDRLGQKGVVTDYVMKAQGAGGQAFRVEAVVKDAAGRNVSEMLKKITLVDPAGTTGAGTMWLPTPVKAGDYRIALSLLPIRAGSTAGGSTRTRGTTSTGATTSTPGTPSAAAAPPADAPPAAAPLRTAPLDARRSAVFAGIYGRGGPESMILFRVRVVPGQSGFVRVTQPGKCPRRRVRRCSFLVAAGTRVRLVALPMRGSRFIGWSTGCGNAPRCTVVAGPVRSIKARFRGPPRVVHGSPPSSTSSTAPPVAPPGPAPAGPPPPPPPPPVGVIIEG